MACVTFTHVHDTYCSSMLDGSPISVNPVTRPSASRVVNTENLRIRLLHRSLLSFKILFINNDTHPQKIKGVKSDTAKAVPAVPLPTALHKYMYIHLNGNICSIQ